MQSECGKIRPRKTPNTDSLHAVCLFERFTGLMTAVHDIIIFFIPHHFSEKKTYLYECQATKLEKIHKI